MCNHCSINSFHVDDASVDFNTETISGQKKVLKMYHNKLFSKNVDLDKWIDRADAIIPASKQDIQSLELLTVFIGGDTTEDNNIVHTIMVARFKDPVTGVLLKSVGAVRTDTVEDFLEVMLLGEQYSSYVTKDTLEKGQIIQRVVYIEDGTEFKDQKIYMQPQFTKEYDDEQLEAEFEKSRQESIKELEQYIIEAVKGAAQEDKPDKSRIRLHTSYVAGILGTVALGLAIFLIVTGVA